MTIKIELYPEIIVTPDELMNSRPSVFPSDDLGLRVLNILSGSSLLTIVMEETDDSFLVGLPCKLMEYGDKKAVQPYVPVKYVRILKSAILVAIPCFGEFEIFYIRWLLDQGKDLFPEHLNDTYIKKLQDRFKKITETVEEMKKGLESIANDGTSEEVYPSLRSPPSKTKH